VVAVDLQQMAPIAGVAQVQGDITAARTAAAVIGYFKGAPADLVVCDGAPDVTGLHDVDEYLQAQLLLAAMNIGTHVLRPGGTYVAKVFAGADTALLTATARALFCHVDIVKPPSSRTNSLEAFIVCRGYDPPPGYVPSMDTPTYGSAWVVGAEPSSDLAPPADTPRANALLVPFLACGDFAGARADPELAAAWERPAAAEVAAVAVDAYQDRRRAALAAATARYAADLADLVL